ncbi:glutamate-1-semialdehyde 2,1-aminomutase [Portibacter lacus]|uniref:Glutamate-1-semialdehyde 2,1-aminomutase n=1 Tax=Portibacter lacus TaxID=1099794 RepID=A0AA37SQR2_9BACT|nr:glutamate-1-semialdehyde 2,1-aminomutase [Portibacter lacus]GLR19111.1 glutamate-1-semialdehyde 2,1-aminomutase [Portibacter lacus]
MPNPFSKSESLFAASKKYIPGGVNSPVRAFKSVGGTPVFIDKAKGAYLYDVDGNSYVDLINSWGPMILGHAHPEVIEAVTQQIKKSFTYGTPTSLELDMAKLMCDIVPGLEMVRMVNSGTEACMSAVRLARGYTGKKKIVKFAGCYHGHHDSFLVEAGSGALTLGSPNSPGVPEETAANTLIAEYNDLASVQALFSKHDDIACVILEPVAGNMGCILPKDGFLHELKALCHKNGALFIMDEVMTGFRLAPGGAQEYFDIQADIICFGKIIGGGMPVGAFGGRKEIFEHLAPLGPVYQAGTLSGNPVAMTAGITTLTILKNTPSIYTELTETVKNLHQSLGEILSEKGIAHHINSIGSMISIFYTDREVHSYGDAKTTDTELFGRLFHHGLKSGIYLPPSNYESWFLGKDIKDKEVEKILETFKTF